MPGFDGNGPTGQGPMTGGGRGYCNPAYAGYHPTGGYYCNGRGMGSGRGFGRGYSRGIRRGFTTGTAMAPPVVYENPADELVVLKQQADWIKNTMDSINRRISELEKMDQTEPDD